jgi:hypothetical protein
MRVFEFYKTSIIGSILIAHNMWYFNTNEIVNKSYEATFLAATTILGFVLLLTGDKWIDKIIKVILDKFKK